VKNYPSDNARIFSGAGGLVSDGPTPCEDLQQHDAEAIQARRRCQVTGHGGVGASKTEVLFEKVCTSRLKLAELY
jgi:hypothetical protein